MALPRRRRNAAVLCGASKQRPDDEEVEDADEAERQQIQDEKTGEDLISPEINPSSRGVILKIENHRCRRVLAIVVEVHALD